MSILVDGMVDGGENKPGDEAKAKLPLPVSREVPTKDVSGGRRQRTAEPENETTKAVAAGRRRTPKLETTDVELPAETEEETLHTLTQAVGENTSVEETTGVVGDDDLSDGAEQEEDFDATRVESFDGETLSAILKEEEEQTTLALPTKASQLVADEEEDGEEPTRVDMAFDAGPTVLDPGVHVPPIAPVVPTPMPPVVESAAAENHALPQVQGDVSAPWEPKVKARYMWIGACLFLGILIGLSLLDSKGSSASPDAGAVTEESK